MNSSTSILGAKPLWGHDFLNFLIPKKCPLYGRFTGVEKNFIRHFEVCEHIELEVCKCLELHQVFGTSPSVWNFTKNIEKNELFKVDFGCKTPLGSKYPKIFTSKKLPPSF